jgi:hypothetical protein
VRTTWLTGWGSWARARLIVYEGVGHIPEVECFEQFNRDLLDFLP